MDPEVAGSKPVIHPMPLLFLTIYARWSSGVAMQLPDVAGYRQRLVFREPLVRFAGRRGDGGRFRVVGNRRGSCVGTFEFFQDLLLKPGGFLDATFALKSAELFRFAGIQFDHFSFIADELRGQKDEEIELLYLTAL